MRISPGFRRGHAPIFASYTGSRNRRNSPASNEQPSKRVSWSRTQLCQVRISDFGYLSARRAWWGYEGQGREGAGCGFPRIRPIIACHPRAGDHAQSGESPQCLSRWRCARVVGGLDMKPVSANSRPVRVPRPTAPDARFSPVHSQPGPDRAIQRSAGLGR